MSNLNYQAGEETLEGSYKPIPVGSYLAMITESSIVPTKNNNGTIIKLSFKILDGDYTDRLVFCNINYENPSDQAQQIGRKELNTIMKAIGISHIQDTSQLCNHPMIIDVKISTSQQFGDQNEIKGYASADNGPTGQVANQPQQQAQPQQYQQQQPQQQQVNNQTGGNPPSWAQ